jgi:hypothetical protein
MSGESEINATVLTLSDLRPGEIDILIESLRTNHKIRNPHVAETEFRAAADEQRLLIEATDGHLWAFYKPRVTEGRSRFKVLHSGRRVRGR